MAKFELDIDTDQFKRGVLASRKGHAAIRETLRLQGSGETINSRRKKRPGEKKKPMHGRFISWFFREKIGIDPFKLEGGDYETVLDAMTRAMVKALDDAYTTGLTQEAAAKHALLMAANEWAKAVQKRIKAGLGTPSAKSVIVKRVLQKYGRIGTKYGSPPPMGIKTGRWVEGIRGRWRQGRI